MKLFDDRDRLDLGSANYSETDYDYLNRSARKEVAEIRRLLQDWLDKFPDSQDKIDMARRLKSGKDHEQLSAFFELSCYNLLFCQGFKIKVNVPANSDEIDFMGCKDGQSFLFECTIDGPSEQEYSEVKAKNNIYDIIDKIKSLRYRYDVEIIQRSSNNPPISQLEPFLHQVEKEADSCCADELYRVPLSGCKCWVWEQAGWKIAFRVMPNSKSKRPIAIIADSLQMIQPTKSMLNVLKRKGKKYGNINQPFIIAIDILDTRCNLGDIIQSLFGSIGFRYDINKFDPVPVRNGDGFWMGPDRPRNTKISAVLVTLKLTPWTIWMNNCILLHNPWAIRPIGQEVWKGDQIYFDSKTYEGKRINGIALPNLLCLPNINMF